MTHTYAILEVSPSAFQEIKEKLLAAGYATQINDETIDMHGIALQCVEIGPPPPPPNGLRFSTTISRGA